MPSAWSPPQGEGETVTLGELNIAANSLIHVDSSSNAQRIADAAVGQVFISGGISTVPAWSVAPVVTTLDVTNIRANDGTAAIIIADSTGIISISVDTNIAATKKLFFDGGGDTYIHEASGNSLEFVEGGGTSSKFAGLALINTFTAAQAIVYDNPRFDLNDDGVASAGAVLSQFMFRAKDDAGDMQIIARIRTVLTAVTAGSLDSDVIFLSRTGGVEVSMLTLDGSANRVKIATDLSIGAADKFYLDGGGDTYIHEVSANLIEIFTGNEIALGLGTGGIGIVGGDKIFLDGADLAGDTYIHSVTSNFIDFVTENTTRFTLSNDVNTPVLGLMGTKAGLLVDGDMANNFWTVAKNTTDSKVYLYVDDGGTIKKVELT